MWTTGGGEGGKDNGSRHCRKQEVKQEVIAWLLDNLRADLFSSHLPCATVYSPPLLNVLQQTTLGGVHTLTEEHFSLLMMVYVLPWFHCTNEVNDLNAIFEPEWDQVI